jgi:hypothetical protein
LSPRHAATGDTETDGHCTQYATRIHAELLQGFWQPMLRADSNDWIDAEPAPLMLISSGRPCQSNRLLDTF